MGEVWTRLEERVAFRLAKSCEVRSCSLPRAGEMGRGVASWEGIFGYGCGCVLVDCFFWKWMLSKLGRVSLSLVDVVRR